MCAQTDRIIDKLFYVAGHYSPGRHCLNDLDSILVYILDPNNNTSLCIFMCHQYHIGGECIKGIFMNLNIF